MSPRRLLLELTVFVCTCAGAAIGYCAGKQFEEPFVQISLAFLGMALGGAFTDLCLRGGNR
jgi:hypothetical protein